MTTTWQEKSVKICKFSTHWLWKWTKIADWARTLAHEIRAENKNSNQLNWYIFYLSVIWMMLLLWLFHLLAFWKRAFESFDRIELSASYTQHGWAKTLSIFSIALLLPHYNRVTHAYTGSIEKKNNRNARTRISCLEHTHQQNTYTECESSSLQNKRKKINK